MLFVFSLILLNKFFLGCLFTVASSSLSAQLILTHPCQWFVQTFQALLAEPVALGPVAPLKPPGGPLGTPGPAAYWRSCLMTSLGSPNPHLKTSTQKKTIRWSSSVTICSLDMIQNSKYSTIHSAFTLSGTMKCICCSVCYFSVVMFECFTLCVNEAILNLCKTEKQPQNKEIVGWE